MSDKLASLLKHKVLRVEVPFQGRFSDTAEFGGPYGYIHLLRDGKVKLSSEGCDPLELNEPGCLLSLRPTGHRLSTEAGQCADLLCARIDFGLKDSTSWLDHLPSFVRIPLKELPAVYNVLELMAAEAQVDRHGQQASQDRLGELLLIHLLRHLLASGVENCGMLAGLADPRVGKAMEAMHDRPGHSWTLDALAELAGMSRARFAVVFRQVVGETPLAYLSAWRIFLAQVALRRGTPVSLVAGQAGYGSAIAFSRAFRSHIGCSPREWVSANLG